MEERKETVVNIDDFKKEERRRKVKEKIDAATKWTKAKFYAAKDFYYENREFLNLAIIPAGMFVWKMISGSSKKAEEKDHKELYIWDNRTGQYYRLRRPLRVGEQLELDRRRSEGESVGQILMSMHVI